MTDFISIHVTTPRKESAVEIGEYLVRAKLVACAQISGPIESIYQWKNKYEHDEEWQLELKTIALNYSKIESYILEKHPYDVPQIIANKIEDGYEKYFDWIRENCY